jgi:signal transduction histidine kinase
VTADEATVVLTVRDFGVGVSREILDRFWKTGTVGVGLAGIRERLKGLGGFLEIQSSPDGTLLKATIPVLSREGTEAEDGSVLSPSTGHAPALPIDS